MKNILFSPLLLAQFLLATIAPSIVSGATKSVTIDWAMADTTNVTGYRMYFSYSSDMSGKILTCETNDPTASSLTCENVNIETYPVYFTVAALTPSGELESIMSSYNPENTNDESTPITLAPVQNFQLFSTSVQIEPTDCATKSILYNIDNADSLSVGIYGQSGGGGTFYNSGNSSYIYSISINIVESNTAPTSYKFRIYDLSDYQADKSITPIVEQNVIIPQTPQEVEIIFDSKVFFPAGEKYMWTILGEEVPWGNRIRTGTKSTGIIYKNTSTSSSGWNGFVLTPYDWVGEVKTCN